MYIFNSFNNRFLIALEQQKRGYGFSPLVAGFKKWQTEFKRTVKKGEKSIHILAPVMTTVTNENGEPLLNDEGKPVKWFVILQVHEEETN